MSGHHSLAYILSRLWKGISGASVGGSAPHELSSTTRSNMRWWFFDGVLGSGADSITSTYLSLYVLSLGGTSGQIGLLSSLSSLVATLVLLPGAILAERVRQRKMLGLISGGLIGRSMLLVMALLPFFLPSSILVYAVIAVKLLTDCVVTLPSPALNSLAADVVPIDWRGRYFGSRTTFQVIITMLMTFVAGQIITAAGEPQGYQIAYIIAFILAMSATFMFSHIQEQPRDPSACVSSPYTPVSLWNTFKSDRNFMAFCVVAAVWNFSIQIGAPFFNVYLVQDLKGTAAFVGLTTILSNLARLPSLRLFGRLNDQWGARKVQMITGLCIPFLPLFWTLSTASWQAIPIQIFGGFFWAGYSLAVFNMLLALSPEEQRPRYSALYQISVSIAAAGGAAFGGLITDIFNYHTAFFLSFVGRMSAAIIFALFVKDSITLKKKAADQIEDQISPSNPS